MSMSTSSPSIFTGKTGTGSVAVLYHLLAGEES